MQDSKTLPVVLNQIGGMGTDPKNQFDKVRGMFPNQIGLQKRINGKTLLHKYDTRILAIAHFYDRIIHQRPGYIDILPIQFEEWTPPFRCPELNPVFEGFDTYTNSNYTYLNGGDWQACHPGIIVDPQIWAFYGVEQTQYHNMGWLGQNIFDPTIWAFEAFDPTATLNGITFSTWVEIHRPQSTSTRTFVSSGDSNGVFNFLGSLDGTWANPHTEGWVRITSSTLDAGFLSSIVDRAQNDNYTSDIALSWFQADLLGAKLILNYWSYQSRPSFVQSNPTHLKISGSNDGITWTTIQEQTGLTWTVNYEWKSWAVVGQTIPYRFFRVTNMALTNSGNNYLTMSELELYGELTYETYP